jgi:hypothetical protein
MRTHIIALALLVALGAASSTGCATIMAGGPDQVQVQSSVPGASVYVDDRLVGQTPMIVTLDREHGQGRIRVEAPGYQPVMVQRTKSINGWFWANICLGGVIGMVIDVATGNIKSYDTAPLNVALTPVPAGYPPPAGGPAPAPAPYPPPTGFITVTPAPVAAR